MDEQLLDHLNVTTTSEIPHERNNATSVLRGIEGGSLHFVTIPMSKDQEFIDHTLLNPEYIGAHITNGFIIDFISNQDNDNAHTTDLHSSCPTTTISTTPTTHFITESPNSITIQHYQQQQQQQRYQQTTHLNQNFVETQYYQQNQNDDNQVQDRKLNTAFLQQYVNKSCPLKIATNEAQVIVKNKDICDQIEDTLKQQRLLSTLVTAVRQNHHHQQQQQSNQQPRFTTASVINDNQFHLYESSSQAQINPTLPPLTPISKLIRTKNNKQNVNVINVQNPQIQTNNSSTFVNNFKNTEEIKIKEDVDVITKSQQQQQQQHRPLAKKNLPHKKRITKKLKIIDRNAELQQAKQEILLETSTPITADINNTANNIVIKNENSIPTVFTTTEAVERNTIPTTQFTCQLCGASSDSQLEFFSHLKEHYEPKTTVVERNSIMTTNTIELSPKKEIFIENPTVSSNNNYNHNYDFYEKKPDLNIEIELERQNKVFSTSIVDQKTIPTITQQVAATITEITEITNNEINKNLNIHIDDDHNSHSLSTLSTKQINIQESETEFSDTEDMLEGIRGVVDKVQESVDNDSNDCMNLMTERAWYCDTTLNGVADIEKLIEQHDQNNTSELTSANDLEVSMDNVEMPIVLSEEKDKNDEIHYKKEEEEEEEMENKQQQITPRKQKTRKKNERNPKTNHPKINSKNNKKRSNYDEIKEADINETIEDKNTCNNNNDKNVFDDSLQQLKSKKKIQCTKCDKLFNSANALKYHNLSHTGERPHQCDICGKSFFAQSALKVHLRLHSGDKPYVCEFCNRPFRQWGDLKYHTISIHTDMKSFQCEFCGKAFARRYSLVVHRRIHTCEKNYKCEFCPKSFRASSYLQNHRKIHTGEKPYLCKVCGKKFRVCGDLRRHENIHTRDKRKSTTNKMTTNIKICDKKREYSTYTLLIDENTNAKKTEGEFSKNLVKSEEEFVKLENLQNTK